MIGKKFLAVSKLEEFSSLFLFFSEDLNFFQRNWSNLLMEEIHYIRICYTRIWRIVYDCAILY